MRLMEYPDKQECSSKDEWDRGRRVMQTRALSYAPVS